MPAVELSRLKHQLDDVSKVFDKPSLYREGINHLLDFYSDRVYRQSPALKPAPFTPSFRVPPLVIRFMEQEFLRLTRANPKAALAVADELWRQNNLEAHLFATEILGLLSSSYKDEVFNRLQVWAEGSDDASSLNLLLTHGTETIRRTDPLVWLRQIETWAHADREKSQILAVKALQAFADEAGFNNLPPVYRLLTPLVLQAGLRLQPSLEMILETLARRSPGETSFFLRQVLSGATNPATIRLIRKIIPAFDPDYQASLKAAVKDLSGRVE
ncbi:MAG: DNA alkylation repair protein [Anaerolineaceae bacterium]